VGVYFNDKTFAMTIFDAEYYDKTEALTQTIYFISFATPFVYALTACTGFVASYLLTRRRRGEFANMRSVGINKRDIFIGALFEQSALCAIGAAIGCAAFRMAWGDVYIRESALFLACYTLGAAISAARVAGTDVLKILRDKE
jgi:ABC-type antimicrobial peptide transport system permease subunit